MEILLKNKIIVLDNKENYFVASTTFYNGILYALLINVNDEKYIIVKEIDENNEKSIELIKDEQELANLKYLLKENID